MPRGLAKGQLACFYRNVMAFILANDQCIGGDDGGSGRGQRIGHTGGGHKNASVELHCCILICEDFLLYRRFHQLSFLVDVAITFAALFHPNGGIQYGLWSYCERYRWLLLDCAERLPAAVALLTSD